MPRRPSPLVQKKLIPTERPCLVCKEPHRRVGPTCGYPTCQRDYERSQNTLTQRERYNYLRAQGRCTRCGLKMKPAASLSTGQPLRSRCHTCRTLRNIAERERAEAARKAERKAQAALAIAERNIQKQRLQNERMERGLEPTTSHYVRIPKDAPRKILDL